MKRIISNSVTEALVESVERADEMEHVLIIATNKTTGGSYECDSSLTLAEAIYMLEKLKTHLLDSKCRCGDGDRE